MISGPDCRRIASASVVHHQPHTGQRV